MICGDLLPIMMLPLALLGDQRLQIAGNPLDCGRFGGFGNLMKVALCELRLFLRRTIRPPSHGHGK